jgi:hypothetical protein
MGAGAVTGMADKNVRPLDALQIDGNYFCFNTGDIGDNLS